MNLLLTNVDRYDDAGVCLGLVSAFLLSYALSGN